MTSESLVDECLCPSDRRSPISQSPAIAPTRRETTHVCPPKTRILGYFSSIALDLTTRTILESRLSATHSSAVASLDDVDETSRANGRANESSPSPSRARGRRVDDESMTHAESRFGRPHARRRRRASGTRARHVATSRRIASTNAHASARTRTHGKRTERALRKKHKTMLDARANANASADARETLASDGRRTTTRVRNASSTVVVVDGASDAGMGEGKGRGKRTRARGMRREIFSSNSSGDNSAKGEARDAEMRRTSVGQRRERRGRHASGGRDVSLVARARDVASEATDVDEHALILSASVGARGRSKRARARAVVRNDDGGHVSEGARRATRRASAKRGKDSGESSQDDVSDDAVVRHWMTLDDACDGGAGWDEGHACDWEMKTAERARDGRSRDETLALADVVKGESHGNVPTFDEVR